ncbi:MAG: phosphoribosyltransferase [Chlorobi bacterium]|nr:phosphoribosyltransferase [Chlorobiota bacterium]
MKIITLNKEDFFAKCKELIDKIDGKPDVVIGVLNGGGYIVDAIKKERVYETVKFEQIKHQRDGELKKENLIFKILLKFMPYAVLDRLRIYESKNAKQSINTLNMIELSKKKLDFKLSITSKELIKNILIIDDAIDTGKTMYIIKNNLIKMFPDINIKIAVISWTIENSIIAPDYYLFKNILLRFPWSKDYKGKDFEKKSFSC